MEYEFVIGMFASKDIAVGTVGSVLELHNAPYHYRWDIVGAGDATRTRNILASRFLKVDDSPFLIFIDRDIVFTPQDIGKLLESLRNGYDLIAGCYVIKDTMTLASTENGVEGLIMDGTIQEVSYLATGFMGVTKNLLKKMVTELNLPLMHGGGNTEAYPFFEQKRHKDPDYGDMWLSEDYDFSEKARQVGVKSYLDTSVRLGHLGDALWRVEGTVNPRHGKGLSKEAQEKIRKIIQEEVLPVSPEKNGQYRGRCSPLQASKNK